MERKRAIIIDVISVYQIMFGLFIIPTILWAIVGIILIVSNIMILQYKLKGRTIYLRWGGLLF